jgi:hypothetical protein
MLTNSSPRRISPTSTCIKAAIASLALMILALTFASGAHAGATKLKVQPKSASVGKRTCFTFSASQAGKPLRNATLRFANRKWKTGKAGTTMACARLLWPGRHAAFLNRRGAPDARVMLRAKGSDLPQSAGTWHQFVINDPAWGDTGSCGLNSLYGRDWGNCTGTVTGVGFAPFEVGKRVLFGWELNPKDLEVHIRSWYFPTSGPQKGMQVFNNVGGWSPSGASGAYYVNWGNLNEIDVHALSSGTDPAKEGQEGGPLHIDVTSHDPFLGNSGYNFYVAGYLFW